MKQHLNIYTNLNFEARIILRSNSWKTNDVPAMRRRVGFNSGAELAYQNKTVCVFEAIAL